MRAKIETAVDGRMLVIVAFEREGVEAATPVIQATFRVFASNNVVAQHTKILSPLSLMRTDTGESVEITDEEMENILDCAAEEISTDVDW